jgi:hypothetical protein
VNSGTTYSEVVAVKIGYYGYVYFVLDASPLMLGVTDLSTVSAYSMSTPSISGLSLVEDGITTLFNDQQYLLLGLQTSASKFFAMSFNITHKSTFANVAWAYSNNAGYAYVVIEPWSNINEFLVGGYITLTSNSHL